MLQVFLPFPKSTISQKFGDNATVLYANEGLKGHPAYDWVVPEGTPILNCVANAYCYTVLHQNDPILMDYRAVVTITEDDLGNVYEITYGHCSSMNAVVGKTYQVGEEIARVGNTGPVYVGNHEVTEAEKDAGSTAGAHLHGPQVRKLAKTKYTNGYAHMVYDANGFLHWNGSYYGIPDYDNGYNGCINFAPFSTETLASEYKAPVIIQTVASAIPAVQAAIQVLPTLPAEEKEQHITWIQELLNDLSKLLSGS